RPAGMTQRTGRSAVMPPTRGRHLVVWILIAAVVAGTSGAGGAQAERMGGFAMPTTPPNLWDISVWISPGAGAFATYGIEATIFTFEGGPAALRALIGGGGEVKISAPGVPPFIAAVAHGADLRAVATYATKHPVAMVVQQEIKRCQDLRGKKIGT